ncbi:MAG TPA: AI-2E family transporter [Chitinophagales bacterium]|nr:AI-2E family transporter [Chitinophagales bacterium]
MSTFDNHKLRQGFLILMILGLTFLITKNLLSYISAILGALTLYILFRNVYLYLTEKKGWKDWLAAGLIMLGATIVLLIPFTFLGYVLVDKITNIINNPQPLLDQWNILMDKIQELTGYNVMTFDTIKQLQGPISSYLPNMVGSTLMIVINFTIMYFILYFMFINGKEMEAYFKKLFPLQSTNTEIISKKGRELIISNTIVIPLLAVIQGVFALIGYLIFGASEPVIMAIITGIASVLPIVGTMIVWIPLALILIAQGHIGSGIGLLLYGGIIVTNIDNVVRFILQKKIANVHPLITVFGVIIGINIFGFVGLIFGPTIISLLILLVDLYTKEFSDRNAIILDEHENEIFHP